MQGMAVAVEWADPEARVLLEVPHALVKLVQVGMAGTEGMEVPQVLDRVVQADHRLVFL